MGVFVSWLNGGRDEIQGDYTNSLGISPGVCTIEVAPDAIAGVDIPDVTDVVFSDGIKTATLKDCKLSDWKSSGSGSGFLYHLVFWDSRWRWKFGHISGEYNFNLAPGVTPEYGTLEREKYLSAWQLCGFLFQAMSVTSFDRQAVPQNDFPYVRWDFDNPADMLMQLLEKYGLDIAFDPITSKVVIVKIGDGDDLPRDFPHTAYSDQSTVPMRPADILLVGEYNEYEVSLELEAVGEDEDGTVRRIDDLSYKPADGWGADFLRQKDTAAGATEDEKQTLASKTVFRWYRVKGGQSIAGFDGLARLEDLLPISGDLVSVKEEPGENGNAARQVRRPAYVYGTWADTGGGWYHFTDKEYPDTFKLLEESGIVAFSEPVFKWSALAEGALPVQADLKLRCTVFGKRYTAKKGSIGGEGVFTFPAPGLTAQFVTFDEHEKRGAKDNKAVVDALAEKILEAKAVEFERKNSGDAEYIGIHVIKIDGKIRQVTWTAGPSGAFTHASANSEHSVIVPDRNERRARERAKKAVTAGLITSKSKVIQRDPITGRIVQ